MTRLDNPFSTCYGRAMSIAIHVYTTQETPTDSSRSLYCLASDDDGDGITFLGFPRDDDTEVVWPFLGEAEAYLFPHIDLATAQFEEWTPERPGWDTVIRAVRNSLEMCWHANKHIVQLPLDHSTADYLLEKAHRQCWRRTRKGDQG